MQYNPQYDDQGLLLDTAKGDPVAFTRLFNKYSDKVYYLSWKLLRSEERAEDTLQEIFLKIWQGREQLGEVQNFKAYLNTLTRNHIYNSLRRQALEENYLRELAGRDIAVADNPAAEALDLAELQKDLQIALGHLTPQQRRVFELSRLEGLRHAEIAEELGVSRNTVRKHMTDALRLLRTHLKGPEKWAQISVLLFFLPS